MRKVYSGSSLVTGLAVLMIGLTSARDARAQFSVSNFTFDNLYAGPGVTALDFGPTGILYLAEKQGRIMALTPNGSGGYNTPQVFADFRGSVDTSIESGLLGIAVDPEFSTSGYIYVFYTTTSDQRLVRYTANAAGTAGSNPTVILSGLSRGAPFHKGGDIKFRPGDSANIYISLGDDGAPGDAQSLTSDRGKMFRVSKTNGNGLSTNPYYVSGALNTVRARLWSIGHRNPFRFTFHPTPNTPAADVLYMSENGDSTDKLSRVRAGSNGSWSTAGDGGGFLNPPDTNHRVLFTDVASHVGLAIAASGPFTSGGSPVLYMANWLAPSGGSIRRWRITGANLDTLTAIAADNGGPFVTSFSSVHLQFGPDGALYWTQSGTGPSSGGFDTGRIRFVGGQPPVAAFSTSPNPATGTAPLSVNFSDASTDSDGTIQSWAWDFGDGNTSSARNPTHTYTSPGNYTVRLTVTDNTALTDDETAPVTAVAAFTLTLDGDVLDGSSLTRTRLSRNAQIRVYQADGTTPIAVPSGVGPNGNGFTVVNGEIDRSFPVNLTGNSVVVTVGEDDASLATQTFGFDVPTGQPTYTQILELRPSPTAISGRVTDTRGDSAAVDIGVARGTISSLYAVSGGRDYLPGSGLGTTGVNHRVVSDERGYYYIPLRDDGMYFLDVVGDTNSSAYVSTLADTTVTANSGRTLDITVGIQAGGANCDDLSGIAVTPNVDYPTQIQPLWDFACTGCHRLNSANGGGLDLTSGGSYAGMVNVASSQVPGLNLVTPGRPEDSYMMEKISCANPQVGNRMRQGSPMVPAEQALVRDWIAQGAVMTAMPGPDGGVPDTGMPMDGGAPDSGNDTGVTPDAGTPTDAASPTPDTGVSVPDAGVRADASSVGTPGIIGGGDDDSITAGCTCTPARASSPPPLLAGLLLLLGLGWVRRSRTM